MSRAGRTVVVLGGLGCVAYGIDGLIGATHTHSRASAVRWFVGGALAHDVLVAPAVIALGALVVRRLPAAIRPYVQSGLFITAGLTLVAAPFLSGRGYQPSNPSALALPYGRGFAAALGVVWALVGLLALIRWCRRAKSPPAE